MTLRAVLRDMKCQHWVGWMALATLLVPISLAYAQSRTPNAPVHEVRKTAHNTSFRTTRSKRARTRSKKHTKHAKLNSNYRRLRNKWHYKAPLAERRAFQREAMPPLILAPVGENARVVLQPSSEFGDFSNEEMIKAETAMAWQKDHSTHPVHPRLLNLVYQALRHFGVPFAWVISGFRANSDTSRHQQGRAIDMVLPGVSDRQLAHYLRTQGFVGVGLYPVSGFVHLDVRDKSFFWIDRSGPDQPSRVTPILKKQASIMDRQARKRGVIPPDLGDSTLPSAADDTTPGNTPLPELTVKPIN